MVSFYMTRSSASREHHAKILSFVLDQLNSNCVPFVVAPYEADAQLAYFSKEMQMAKCQSLVITEDSDAIPYGVRTTLFKLTAEPGE